MKFVLFQQGGQEKMNERFSGRKSKNEKSRTDFDYLDRVTDEEILDY